MNKVLQKYLFAEAVRNIEEIDGGPIKDAEAEKYAITAGITFSQRILARAEKLAAQLGIDEELDNVSGRIRFIITAFAVCCFIIGIGVTRAIPEGYPVQANVVSLLAILLLPNGASLILWLVITIYSPFWHGLDSANGWLGRRALGIYTFIEGVIKPDRYARGAGRAWRDFITKTAGGRYRLTLISHYFWISAITGALIGCWWLMVVRQVDFVWGSTLLTADQVRDLLGKLTDWVSLFGFRVPAADDIVSSRIDAQVYTETLRRSWGIFILGAVLTLGLLPRLLAVMIDLGAYLYTRNRLQPDLSRPGYVRLQSILMPLIYARTILDADNDTVEKSGALNARSSLSRVIPRDAAWLALEHKPDISLLEYGIRTDLGVITSFEEQQTVLNRLASRSADWTVVCVYIDLSLTPDRGISRLLTRLKDKSLQDLHIVFAVTARASTMQDSDLQARRTDWVQLVDNAGIAEQNIHLIG